MVSKEDFTEIFDEHLGEACMVGGVLQTMKDFQGRKQKEGVAGLPSMEGDRTQPEKF